MATLKPVPWGEITFKPTYTALGDLHIVNLTAAWKTWYGWALDVLLPDESPYDFENGPRFNAARMRAAEDLNRRIGITFAQLAELVEDAIPEPVSEGV